MQERMWEGLTCSRDSERLTKCREIDRAGWSTLTLFVHYFEAKVGRECFAQIFNSSRAYNPSVRSSQPLAMRNRQSQPLLWLSGRRAVSLIVYYGKSVVFVLILSLEASKQIASSVVTGQPHMHKLAFFQCEQQKALWWPGNEAMVILCVHVYEHN